MSGVDGVSSLHKLLGALQVTEAGSTRETAQAAATAKTAAAVPGSGATDKASLSAAGLASGDVSDVRTTRVAELRQAISNGTYNVPSSAVAGKIVDSLLS